MIGVEAVVVFAAVRKLNIDGQEACFYELKVEQQPPRSTVSVNKRMNRLEFEVEQCDGFQYMFFFFPEGILLKQLIDGRFYLIRLKWGMECS